MIQVLMYEVRQTALLFSNLHHAKLALFRRPFDTDLGIEKEREMESKDVAAGRGPPSALVVMADRQA
jgi:hypothetical protein